MATDAHKVGRTRKPLVHQGVELRCTSRYEAEARAAGHVRVAGVDEVGRGALCGPVVAGAVILGDDFDTTDLDDSKRLTRRQRERLSERIRGQALAWAIGAAEPHEIDRVNILQATYIAMQRALAGLRLPPDFLLLDALKLPGVEVPQLGIVKGDALSVSIAAASIIAKVARDAAMRECETLYPGYGLGHNMGYASEDHRDALHRLGPSVIHRRSFQGTQPWLF